MPTTAIIAAMPVAMPTAVRKARLRPPRRPEAARRRRPRPAAGGLDRTSVWCLAAVVDLRPSRIVGLPGEGRGEFGVVGDDDDGGPILVAFEHGRITVSPVWCRARRWARRQARVAGAPDGTGDGGACFSPPESGAVGGRAVGQADAVGARHRLSSRRSLREAVCRGGRWRRCRGWKSPSSRWKCWKTNPMEVAQGGEVASRQVATSCPSISTLAGAGAIERADDVEHGRLARARRADNRDEFARAISRLTSRRAKTPPANSRDTLRSETMASLIRHPDPRPLAMPSPEISTRPAAKRPVSTGTRRGRATGHHLDREAAFGPREQRRDGHREHIARASLTNSTSTDATSRVRARTDRRSRSSRRQRHRSRPIRFRRSCLRSRCRRAT